MAQLTDELPIVALFRFNARANARLLDTCAGLTHEQHPYHDRFGTTRHYTARAGRMDVWRSTA